MKGQRRVVDLNNLVTITPVPGAMPHPKGRGKLDASAPHRYQRITEVDNLHHRGLFLKNAFFIVNIANTRNVGENPVAKHSPLGRRHGDLCRRRRIVGLVTRGDRQPGVATVPVAGELHGVVDAIIGQVVRQEGEFMNIPCQLECTEDVRVVAVENIRRLEKLTRQRQNVFVLERNATFDPEARVLDGPPHDHFVRFPVEELHAVERAIASTIPGTVGKENELLTWKRTKDLGEVIAFAGHPGPESVENRAGLECRIREVRDIDERHRKTDLAAPF